MRDFTFFSPTKFVFGKGVTDKVGEELAAQGFKHVLMVYGQGSVVRTGTLDRVKKSLDAASVAYTELAGARPNPEVTLVREGIKAAQECGADALLAVGGGSAIDTAKAISLGISRAADGVDVWQIFMGAEKPNAAAMLPVADVLTIPAAGSEGSASCVISNDEVSRKRGCSSELVRPVLSVMDPELTFTLPPYQTAAGVTDMCAHIMERYFSAAEDVPVTDNIGCALIRSLIECAPVALAEPENYDARASIMWAGTLAHNDIAGLGRNLSPSRAGGWESHGIEHELSAHFPAIAHGAGLAVIFPAWMRHVWTANPARFLAFGKDVFDIEPVDVTEDGVDITPEQATRDAVLATIDELQAFFKSMGMPSTLGELGVKESDIDALLETLRLNKGDKFGEFMTLTMDDVREIYRSAL